MAEERIFETPNQKKTRINKYCVEFADATHIDLSKRSNYVRIGLGWAKVTIEYHIASLAVKLGYQCFDLYL